MQEGAGVALRPAAGRQEGARLSPSPRVQGGALVLSWRVREAILLLVLDKKLSKLFIARSASRTV